MRKRIGIRQLLCVALLAACGQAHAQTTNATLVGTVLDPAGAAVAGAEITATHTATGVSRKVETDGFGNYRIFPLNPGSYDLTATMAGFTTKRVSGVVLEVAANVKVDLQLEVGQVTESVEISAQAAVLQTQDASVGGTVTSTELARMPVNGRNFTRLMMLLPGTSDVGGSQSRGTFSGTQMISVNGQRRQDNNFTVDGVDNNFMMMNSPGASPSMDALQEFRIMSNTSAEFGRSAGANVNLAIKSGTRDLHGSVYHFLRNDKLDANDFFANRSNRGKVPFRQNQFGFALGGPVFVPKVFNGRDSTFWFVSWEGYRSRRGSTAISNTPIAAQRAGDFSQQPRTIYDPLTSQAVGNQIQRQPFAGNRIPTARIDPAITFLLDTMMPLPNFNLSGLNQNLLNTQSRANDRDVLVLRGDHTFNSKDNVTFRYLKQKVSDLAPNANPNLYGENGYDIQNVMAGWNHIFSPSSILELKFAWNSPNNPSYTFNRAITREDFLDKAGITMYQRDVLARPIPNFNAVGEFSVGGGGSDTSDDIYQVIANFSKIVGKHSIKFGVNYSHRHFFTDTSNPMNGDANFDRRLTSDARDNNSGHSFATMLLGYPTEIRRGQGNTLTQGRIFARNFFVQDDWRVTNRLTVNLGLRYEYQNAPYDTTDRLGNLWVRRDPQSGQYTGTLLWATTNPEPDPDTGQRNLPARTGGFGRALMQNDYNNFAPRIGIAWQVTDKTVVRTGYGIFYNSTFVQELQDMRKFWPFTVQQVFVANTDTLPDLNIRGAGPSFSNTAAIGGWPQNPENRTPYSQQWNFSIQQQLLSDLTVDVAYIGSANKKQVGYTALNPALAPGPGPVQPRRLLPNFGDLDGGSNAYGSNYNAMQIKVDKRFARGLLVHANYTWGRAMDDQSSLAEWKTQDAFNKRADYSRSSIDIRQIFQLAYVYELPFGRGRKFGADIGRAADALLGGWEVEGITRIQTGGPLNVVVGQDRANVGRTYQRPNVIRNPNIGGFNRDPGQTWFDTGAFQLQPIYTFGNAGAFIVDADGRHNWDFSLAKKFWFGEQRRHLEFRAEMFNMPNHVNFGNPQTNFASSAFGRVSGATAARQIQFALRFAF